MDVCTRIRAYTCTCTRAPPPASHEADSQPSTGFSSATARAPRHPFAPSVPPLPPRPTATRHANSHRWRPVWVSSIGRRPPAAPAADGGAPHAAPPTWYQFICGPVGRRWRYQKVGIGVQQSCSIHAHVHVHVHVHVLLRPSTHPLKPRVSPALPSRRTAIAASWPTRFTLAWATCSSACLLASASRAVPSCAA